MKINNKDVIIFLNGFDEVQRAVAPLLGTPGSPRSLGTFSADPTPAGTEAKVEPSAEKCCHSCAIGSNDLSRRGHYVAHGPLLCINIPFLHHRTSNRFVDNCAR